MPKDDQDQHQDDTDLMRDMDNDQLEDFEAALADSD